MLTVPQTAAPMMEKRLCLVLPVQRGDGRLLPVTQAEVAALSACSSGYTCSSSAPR
jgi:hypothetical protein